MVKKNKRARDFRYLLPVYFLLLLVMFILPFFSVVEYSILKNTTSHLGAQNTPNAWLMNLVFCLIGSVTILEAWLHLNNFWMQKILLTVFGLALILTAFFSHAPIVDGTPHSVREDQIHSLLASTIGFTFTVFAISAAFIENTPKKRFLALLIGILAILLSLLMLSFPDFSGIWQRLIFIFSFGWLVYFYEGMRT